MIVLCVQKVFGVLDPNGALISGGVRPRVDHNWVLGFFMPFYCTVLGGKWVCGVLSLRKVHLRTVLRLKKLIFSMKICS